MKFNDIYEQLIKNDIVQNVHESQDDKGNIYSIQFDKGNDKYLFNIINDGFLKEMTNGMIDHPEGQPYSVSLINKETPSMSVKQYLTDVEDIVPTIRKMEKDFL